MASRAEASSVARIEWPSDVGSAAVQKRFCYGSLCRTFSGKQWQDRGGVTRSGPNPSSVPKSEEGKRLPKDSRVLGEGGVEAPWREPVGGAVGRPCMGTVMSRRCTPGQVAWRSASSSDWGLRPASRVPSPVGPYARDGRAVRGLRPVPGLPTSQDMTSREPGTCPTLRPVRRALRRQGFVREGRYTHTPHTA